jgi:hypothetical protein
MNSLTAKQMCERLSKSIVEDENLCCVNVEASVSELSHDVLQHSFTLTYPQVFGGGEYEVIVKKIVKW